MRYLDAHRPKRRERTSTLCGRSKMGALPVSLKEGRLSMFQTQCANCGQPRGFARRLGFGTFFMVLITFGLWLFVIPFYPKRCSVCGCVRSATNIVDAVAQ